MDTNGHEEQKDYLTTKDTKSTKKKVRGGVRTTNGHEIFNHETHEIHENNGIIMNHEWTRMDTNGHEFLHLVNG